MPRKGMGVTRRVPMVIWSHQALWEFHGCRCRELWLSPHLYAGHSLDWRYYEAGSIKLMYMVIFQLSSR